MRKAPSGTAWPTGRRASARLTGPAGHVITSIAACSVADRLDFLLAATADDAIFFTQRDLDGPTPFAWAAWSQLPNA